jgi:hypothetical protein
MLDVNAYRAVCHALATLQPDLADGETDTLRGAADALALADPEAERRLARAERLLARLESSGRVACETIEGLHVALRGIDPRIPLPC